MPADSSLRSDSPSSTRDVLPRHLLAKSAGAALLLGALCALGRVGRAPRSAPAVATATPPASIVKNKPRAQTAGTQPLSLAPFLQPRTVNAAPKSTSPNAPAATTSATTPGAQGFARALQLQKSGKWEQAASAYHDVLQKEPTSASAWLNLSLLYLQHRQPQRAVEPLRRVAALEPKNLDVRRQLAQTLVALRRPQEALAPMRELVRLQPNDKASRADFAQLLQALNKPRDAYAQWTALANLDPKNPAPAFWAGALALEVLRRPADAEKWLRRAVSLQTGKPRDPRAPLLLAQTLLARQKPQEAARVCEDAAKQFPDVVELRTTLADARLGTRDLPGAIAATREAIAILPSDAPTDAKTRLHFGLARMLLAANQAREAVPELKLAAQLAPKNPEIKALLTAALAQSSGKIGAPKLANNPDAAVLQRAQTLANAKKWSEAARQYAAYTKAQPRDVAALAEFASVQDERKQWRESARLWAQVSALAPRTPLPLLRRFDALRRLNRQTEALQTIRAALALAPREPAVLLRAADAEANAGHFAPAREYLQTLLTLEPNFAPGYGALALSGAKSNQVAPTAKFLQAQVAKIPRQRIAYDAILALYDEANQPKTGRDIIKTFITRDPKNPAPRLALDSFDLANAKRQLAELEARDRLRTKSTKPPVAATPGEMGTGSTP